MRKLGGNPRIGLVLGASVLALSACVQTDNLDWDLRAGSGGTSDAARQATAAVPTPDANGILSYPDYQLAKARRMLQARLTAITTPVHAGKFHDR